MRFVHRPPSPGIDPWLEHTSLWPNVHTSLVVALRNALVSRVKPRYQRAIKKYTARRTTPQRALLRVSDVSLTAPTLRTDNPAPTNSQCASNPSGDHVRAIEVPMPRAVAITKPHLNISKFATDAVVTRVKSLCTSHSPTKPGRSQELAKRVQSLKSKTNPVKIERERAPGRRSLRAATPKRSDDRALVSRGARYHTPTPASIQCESAHPPRANPTLPRPSRARAERAYAAPKPGRTLAILLAHR